MPRHIPSPASIQAAGNRPKMIHEHIGRVNTGTDAISVARMISPPGWVEPGQRPEFDEYSLVLRGVLAVRAEDGTTLEVRAGEAVIAAKGEWVQYSTPEGAEYVAVCVPAFSPETVHRDGD
ncbi:MAG TPA: cupin domain-containing protein [Candidatus Hydrogenedentes bacterium]|nr:cupin domain-containing protein [Candidatus Hydrogenedentota bacterium]HNT88806.1 cupin domain-containing protein [Candidatus Hydrogenedentota bacterium]